MRMRPTIEERMRANGVFGSFKVENNLVVGS